MPALPISGHTPDTDAGSDLRTPSQTSHVALVTSSLPIEERERPAGNPRQVFGARLKSARERRGITLKTVAATTKVATSLFEALERGDVSRWPKGLYRRAFFRGYVVAIGLPTDSTVDEFLRLFPDEYTPIPRTARAADEPGTDPFALRLTMAPETRRARLLRGSSRTAVMDALTVLAIALALVWWTSMDVRTGAFVVALCYYPHLARLLRWRGTRRTNTTSVPHLSSERLESEPSPEPAVQVATATS